MKNSQRLTIAIIILVVIIGIYFYSKNKTQTPVAPTISGVTETVSTSTPVQTSYVSLIESSTHEALFKFNVSVDPKDLTIVNVKPCVADSSAGAGVSVPCQPPNKFKVSFNQTSNILTISEININSKDKDRIGIFRTGCASCTVLVSFANLHNVDGKILPAKTVTVY